MEASVGFLPASGHWEGWSKSPPPVPGSGPRILVCTGGAAGVRTGDTELSVKRGGSLWLGAGDRSVVVSPRAEGTQLFLAGDGLD